MLKIASEQNLRYVTENLQHTSHEALQKLLGLWKISTSTLVHAQQSLTGSSKPIKSKDSINIEPQESGAPESSAADPPLLSPSGSKAEMDPGEATLDLYEEALETPPEEFSSDCMAVAVPPPSSSSAPAPGTYVVDPPSGDMHTTPSAVPPYGPPGVSTSSATPVQLVDDFSAAPVPPSALSVASVPASWPRVTARIVDPTNHRGLGTQSADAAGSNGGVAQLLLAAAQLSALTLVGIMAWTSGRHMTRGPVSGNEDRPALVVPARPEGAAAQTKSSKKL